MSRRDLNSRVEHSKGASQADFAKYAAAVLLVVAGVFAFYWFEAQLATVVRSVIVALCIVGVGGGAQTNGCLVALVVGDDVGQELCPSFDAHN